MNRVLGLLRRRVVQVGLVLTVVGVTAGLVWFQPWKLWVDETVEESVPTGAQAADGAGKGDTGADSEAVREEPEATGKGAGAADKGSEDGPEESKGPEVLARGELISHEHATEGTVRVLRLADGSRVLRLEDLATSNGPDLRVWVTDAPVREGKAGWHVFDDGRYESLGRLKGNRGSQNYALPGDLDLGDYTSVSIWCDRFDVSFGAAKLSPA